MKMSKESYAKIVNAFAENKKVIVDCKEYIIKEGKAKDVYTRMGFDALRAFVGVKFITQHLYEVEGLNDTHITTAVKKALIEIGV